MICGSLFLTSAILPNKSWAEDEICFDASIAKEIVSDLKICQETETQLNSLRLEFDIERNAFDALNDNLMDQISLLDDQRQDEHNRGEAYRLEWKECGKTLTKCQQSKPNRKTWFGAGFGSALLLAILIIAL